MWCDYDFVYTLLCVFFFKQKTAYEMRISDWSSDVCSSDLPRLRSVNSPASEYLEPVAARFSRPVHPRRSPPLVREPGGALSVPPHDWHRPPNLGRCTWGAAMGEDLNVHTWELLSA